MIEMCLPERVGVVAVDSKTCIRCGACAVVAPAIFGLDRKGTRVLRQPDQAEHTVTVAATLVCPTRAIVYRSDAAR